jgi:hypothetical protein
MDDKQAKNNYLIYVEKTVCFEEIDVREDQNTKGPNT